MIEKIRQLACADCRISFQQHSMRLRRGNTQKGQNDPEFYFGLVFVPLAMLASGLAVLLPGRWVLPCTFHRITGLPCPTCGTYRCIEAILHGRIIEALHLQPLVFFALAGAFIYFIYSLIVVTFRLPRIRLEDVTRANRWMLAGIITLLILINWAYLIVSGR